MSVLINKDTRVVVSGLTGKTGTFHADQCMRYGTKIVGGVTPGKGGMMYSGNDKIQFERPVPVFNTIADSVSKEGANACVIFVPPPFAADSILEAIDAGVETIICITEGIPVRDMAIVRARLNETGCKSRLIGPNCPGVITPGECKIGIMPAKIHRPGTVGIVSKSGTLTYEAAFQVSNLGYGQSTTIGIGGDPINGTSMLEAVQMFNADPQTEAIIMIGEIGGNNEQIAAQWLKENCKKPVAAFIAGTTAPKGRRMGHAGAIVTGKSGSAAEKIATLKACGIEVAPTPAQIGKTLLKVWGK
ncbi:succinate--CoA ligase subunit alpha [Intestinicryptomonas porci]|uniref:Succinate--CoA ligase [ADP-forming] subunit alpha n=1 Tax=Intestinicryptomonas porci TaxID=2926320 RepID=A0ABU4WGK9_9BACT|nr:succinate--CoA ligase subunit alpha [Opitutales bacterium CLA-KB-P66]